MNLSAPSVNFTFVEKGIEKKKHSVNLLIDLQQQESMLLKRSWTTWSLAQRAFSS